MIKDEYWMKIALEEAKLALIENEVPVGAVLIHNDKLIAQAHNQPIIKNDPTAHAEIVALRSGAKTQKNYRLNDCTLYVTLEPCAMCVGAMVHARIKRLVFGALDPKTGAVVSAIPLLEAPHNNHKVEYTQGVLQDDCSAKLSAFFKQKR